MQRLRREDEAARKRGEEYLKKKIETSQLVEQTRMETVEVLSAMEHERSLEIQRAKEKMKAETAKVISEAVFYVILSVCFLLPESPRPQNISPFHYFRQ
jgi:hypothetical protein